MSSDPTDHVGLEFLDGYLFRIIQEILEAEGAETGLYNYYRRRIELRLGGMVPYEAELAQYVLANFRDRRVVHAGIGLGLLAAALSVNGVRMLGVECDENRMRLARRVRDAVCRTWPEAEPRYQLLEGMFPEAIADDWIGRDVVVLFTNVASWEVSQLDGVVEFLPRFGDAIVGLRLFGRLRDSDEERRELFDRLARRAKKSTVLANPPIAESGDIHFARFSYSP